MRLRVLTGRRPEPLAQVAAEIARLGRHALAVVADVTDPQSTRALFARIDKEFGRLDLLFNNAGTNARMVPLEEPTLEFKHVADAVTYMASLPLSANVLFMTIMATKMPFVGRG